MVKRDHLRSSRSPALSQLPLTDLWLCLQAAASASASANADVVAKESDIAVPVIITKKQGEWHWCRCQSVAQEELCLTGSLIAHVRGTSAEGHSCSAAGSAIGRRCVLPPGHKHLAYVLGLPRVHVAFIDLPILDNLLTGSDCCQQAVWVPCRCLFTTSTTTVSAGCILGLPGTNSAPWQLFRPHDELCTSTCF